MKTIAIWDIHWRDSWKTINIKAENIVFIWDYFDSLEQISIHDQIQNFRDILKFKKKYKEQVTLIIWNHDFHYFGTHQRYSWYQYIYESRIKAILSSAIKSNLLTFAKIIDGVLYTHAGVTKTWLKISNYKNDMDLDNFINSLPYHKFETHKSLNYSLDEINQSPIWVRPKGLVWDKVDIKQVVGHTSQDQICFSADKKVAFIDTLWTSWEYLVVDDGEF